MLCCIIFSVFIGCLFGFSIWGLAEGEVDMLMSPVDGNGNICGFSVNATTGVNVTAYPALWIADLDKATSDPTNMFKYAVCVKECPTKHNETVQC